MRRERSQGVVRMPRVPTAMSRLQNISGRVSRTVTPKNGAPRRATAKRVACPRGNDEDTEKKSLTKTNKRTALAATAAHGCVPNAAKPKNASAVESGA